MTSLLTDQNHGLVMTSQNFHKSFELTYIHACLGDKQSKTMWALKLHKFPLSIRMC